MSGTGPALSLIVGTVDRHREPLRLIASLNRQSFDDTELIIVDQNERDRSDLFRDAWAGDGDRLVYVRTSRSGAARARNVGLRHAGGRIVAFPDDDCWYPPALLSHVVDALERHPERDGLTCRAVDGSGDPVGTRWSPSPGPVDRLRVWGQGIEYTIFLRASVIERVGGFDETLGPGAEGPWGCGEGTDLLLRALADGADIFYRPDLVVHHPDTKREEHASPTRVHAYAMGMGRVLATHEFPLWYVAYQMIRPLGGMLLALARSDPERSRHHGTVALARMRGWWRCARR